MADNLKLFGTTYTGVEGLKVTNTSDQQLTYIRPTGTKSITGSGNTDVTNYATASVAAGSASTPATSVTANPTISVGSDGKITASVSKTQSVTPSVSAGYVSSGTAGNITVSGSGSYQLPTDAGSVVTPSTSQQTVDVDGKFMTGDVVVNPIPSEYIIPTGTKQITANGTGIDVAQYAAVDVNVSGGGGSETAAKLASGKLTTLTDNDITYIKGYACAWCSDLTSVECESVTQIEQYSFGYCTSLTSVKLHKVGSIKSSGQYAFRGCTALTAIALPLLANVEANTFYQCSNLEKGDFKASGTVRAGAFSSCTKFNFLVLRSTTVGALANINAFASTPFASGGAGGTLYVPNSILTNYQSASNWSTILGYANNSIKSIESTHTDPNAPIDLTLYYADGTLIPT